MNQVYDMTKRLTMRQKSKWLSYLIERDGNCCFYCEQRFLNSDQRWERVFDHLNNREDDNRPENLVLSHWKCNEQKKSDGDMQIRAIEKLENNEHLAESLGVEERKNLVNMETNMEIDTNREFSKITEEYLIEHLFPHHGKPALETTLDYKEILDSITLRCYRKNTHASQNTIRRILDMFCSSEGNFEILKSEGRRKILLRKEN